MEKFSWYVDTSQSTKEDLELRKFYSEFKNIENRNFNIYPIIRYNAETRTFSRSMGVFNSFSHFKRISAKEALEILELVDKKVFQLPANWFINIPNVKGENLHILYRLICNVYGISISSSSIFGKSINARKLTENDTTYYYESLFISRTQDFFINNNCVEIKDIQGFIGYLIDLNAKGDFIVDMRKTHLDIQDGNIISHLGDSITVNNFVSKSPTTNCQLFSIGSFYNLVHYSKDVKHLQNLVQRIRSKIGSKNLLFVDVTNKNADIIKKIEDAFIVIAKTPYRSTNGSNMVTFLLNVKTLGQEGYKI